MEEVRTAAPLAQPKQKTVTAERAFAAYGPCSVASASGTAATSSKAFSFDFRRGGGGGAPAVWPVGLSPTGLAAAFLRAGEGDRPILSMGCAREGMSGNVDGCESRFIEGDIDTGTVPNVTLPRCEGPYHFTITRRATAMATA